MMPGHPAGAWGYEPQAERTVPTPADVGRIFDEQDRTATLSPEMWQLLRWLGDAAPDAESAGDAVQWGTFVCRPNPEEFDPLELEGEISEARLTALLDFGAAPTRKEITRWQELQMERAMSDSALGLYTAFAWPVHDDRGRERVLVTLHVDDSSFERVAGLYGSVEEAATALGEHRSFEWLW